MSRAVWLVVLLSAMALTGTAQSPSAVRGRVFAADGIPLHNVRIQVRAGSQPPAPVFSDADGAFTVTATAGGTLSVTKSGYLPATIAIQNAREIRLVKAAAISGRIVDPAGDALAGM